MRYIIEIDPSSPEGAQLLQYISDLHAPDTAVRVHKTTSISDEAMAMPGKKPSTQELEEWLALPDTENYSSKDALSMLKEELATYRRNKK